MSKLPHRTSDPRVTRWSAAGVSILNGIFGDHLEQRRNGLALRMAFMHGGWRLALTPAALQQAHPAASARLCILVHGLCCNENTWRWNGARTHDEAASYGSRLQADFGYTPFYLRYNSGLPLAQNGAALAALLAELLAAYPLQVEEIVLIGHSMGGLVLRGACEVASRQRLAWAKRVTRVFYLGTPHEGAPLEQITHRAVAALNMVPNPITSVIGEVLDLRSRGIKDLRRSDALAPPVTNAKSHSTAWLASARHYLIAGSLTDNPQHIASLLLGDLLVRLPHKKGVRADSSAALPEQNIKVFAGIHHMQLAHDAAVYQQIRTWCATD